MGLGFLTRDNVLHLVIPTDKRSYHKYFRKYHYAYSYKVE